MKHLLKSLVMGAAFLLAAVPLRAQYGEMPPLHVDGKYLKDPHGNIVNLHGVMDTPNPYFNNYRWGNSCETSGDILKCREYFDKLFAALTDTAQGAWCNIFRLHLDPCWTNDPDLPIQGTETGEANISRFSRVRLNKYLRSLFVPLAESAMEHGLYVVMRPPGVCPGTIQVGGEYQKYLMDVWDAVSSYSKVKEYSGQLFIELANEPVTVLDENGEDTPEALHDFFQPIVDMIRANGYTGVIWVPGSGWQANYKNYASHPITGYNIGYAVHAYVGWYNCDDETATPERFIEEFGKSVPVVETNPVLVTEVDWSPESDSNGHYNEHGEWVPGNMGTWATGTTSGWGNSFKAMMDHYGNVGMTLTGTADYIDIDTLMQTGKVVPAFDGEPEACAQACFEWYADYAKVNVPRADFTYRRAADKGNGTFVNPIIHADFPDPDIIRVDDTYYLVTTTMYFFPGATILKSKDLVNWEYCANPLQQISNSDAYNLANGWNHYAGGQWAPSLRYRDGKFYLHFVAFDHEEVQDGGGFLLTATDPEGKWEMQEMEGFYYDAGLLFDGEDTYIAHGIDEISVTQLDENFKAVRTEKVITVGNGCEGSHFYHIGDYYYIYATYGGTEGSQTIFRSTSPFGPYEEHEGRIFEKQHIHQGGLVETQTGEWWTILFKDAGTVGRVPFLEPVEWVDGWPVIGKDGIDVSQGGSSYKKPDVGQAFPVTYLPTNDTFTDPALGLQWQWNHNPDNAGWSLFARPGWLRLNTVSVTDDLKQARNMLTQRIFAYENEGADAGSYRDSYGTARIDLSGMQEGDVCGLCVFQDPYGYIGVKMEGGQRKLVYYRSAYADGTVAAETVEGDVVAGPEIYLRAVVNFGTNKAQFYYSTDNKTYAPFGNEWTMRYTLEVFTGNRFGLFNYATEATGGYVDIDWFSTEPDFSEEKYYAEGTLQTFTEDDLTMVSLTVPDAEVNLLPGERYTLDVTATFRSERTENVSATCQYEFSNPGVVSVQNGFLTGLVDGETDVTVSYTDFMGNTMSETFTVTVATFPLTNEGFNPSIWETGTFDESTGCFVTGQYGFSGWQYSAGVDLSAYNYIVVRLKQSTNCGLSFRLYDNSSYWSTPYMCDMGSKTEIVVDLKNMVKEDGTKCDPSHIYIAGFWTYGGTPVYLKEVFLSNDGKTPVEPTGVEETLADGDAEVVSVEYYSLSGQMFAAPQRGLNIVKRTLSDGRVVVKKEMYR